MHKRPGKNIFCVFLCFFVALFFSGIGICYGQGLQNLVGKVSEGVLAYFTSKGEGEIRTSIIKFDNFSDLSDLTAHKFYQQLAANLETHSQVAFSDLMINFFEKRGEFNLNRINQLNYLISIKLIQNKNKVGAAAAIFSRALDKIVYIKYFEEVFSTGERDIYETRDYGFKSLGFSRQIEIDAKKDLLDFKSIAVPGGAHQYFFYYPKEVEIFKVESNYFKKFFSFDLEWGRPYYPVINVEGRMCLFYPGGADHGDILYLTVGSNFSPHSKVFSFRDNVWREIDTLGFVPMKLIRLNDNAYLAGARYDEGKNFFKDKLMLVPFVSGQLEKGNFLEKKVVPFYSLDFSTFTRQPSPQLPRNVESVHLIDTDYNYRFFAGDFEERTPAPEKRGSALAALASQWLAVSDYSTSNNKDSLYFYKIEQGSKQLAYENRIDGQVIFISAGAWKGRQGFWTYVKKIKDNNRQYTGYYLQFWGKNKEKENDNG